MPTHTQKIEIRFVDAFTNQQFKGNPAAVVILASWIPEVLMQLIASENNLSETAFIVKQLDGKFHIRWFSPLKEIAFCGHATLASAFVLKKIGESFPIVFWAPAVGDLEVHSAGHHSFDMKFPLRTPQVVDEVPLLLLSGLSKTPKHVLRNQQAYFAVYEDAQDVLDIKPDFSILKGLAPFDVVVSATGTDVDFVSRYFWPANGGEEDPVTGSIHAGLAPYWAQRLGKPTLIARQVSKRTGIVYCEVLPDEVKISGSCVLYLEGLIEIPTLGNIETEGSV